MSRHKTAYVILYHGILCHDMSYVTTIVASLVCVCVCMYVRVFVCVGGACMHAWVWVCVRACVCTHAYVCVLTPAFI